MYRNTIEYQVEGSGALFVNPLLKSDTDTEVYSYLIPTYQALVGITEAIYWKPTIKWIVDECRVISEIRTEEHFFESQFISYLSDVKYQIRAHFVWNEERPDLEKDRNENKHWDMAKRYRDRGGRKPIYLGHKEFVAKISPCIFGEGESWFDNMAKMQFGIVYHSIYRKSNTEKYSYWNAVMDHGIINYPKIGRIILSKNAFL